MRAACLIAFILFAAAGCTTAKSAVGPTVVLIIDRIDAYEQGLDARVAAEEKYYAAHTATLDRAAREATLIARDVRQRELIVTYADAARADGQQLRLSRLMRLLTTADDEFSTALVEYVKLAAENRTTTNNAFAALESKRQEVAAIRAALEEILHGGDVKARVKFWSDYAKRVNDELNKTSKHPTTTK